jgi:hypothetical protein
LSFAASSDAWRGTAIFNAVPLRMPPKRAIGKSARPSEIRIAPSGGIYMDGKPATLKDAFEVIIRTSTEPGLTHRQINVCVAPPFRSLPHRELDQKVEYLFASLARHGKAHSVVVSKSW